MHSGRLPKAFVKSDLPQTELSRYMIVSDKAWVEEQTTQDLSGLLTSNCRN